MLAQLLSAAGMQLISIVHSLITHVTVSSLGSGPFANSEFANQRIDFISPSLSKWEVLLEWDPHGRSYCAPLFAILLAL